MTYRPEYIRDRLDVGRETLTHAGILGETLSIFRLFRDEIREWMGSFMASASR
jgi:hypothetical protein